MEKNENEPFSSSLTIHGENSKVKQVDICPSIYISIPDSTLRLLTFLMEERKK